MKTFDVVFSAIAYVEVEAEDEKSARQKARRQLDPGVDWDFQDIEILEETI